MAKQPKWRPLLLRFISELRIVSREESVKLGEQGTKIELWQSQRRILDRLSGAMDGGIRHFNVLKSRQLGSTTVFVIIALFWLALHPKMKGAMVFDQDKTREEFREQIRTIVASIPKSYMNFAIVKGGDNKFMMRFSNGSQLTFLVAGVGGSKEAWGESAGFSFVLLTEVASYGSEAGLNNFEEAMSETNPDRLYVYESTAKGYNHWKTRWDAGRADPFTQCNIFVGWWSKELNAIPRSDPRFALYGLAPPDDRERARIKIVRERYEHEITAEQLTWIRWRMASGKQTESSLNQNQPWIEEEAFILTGKSFFQIGLIARDYERAAVTPYMGWRFWLGNDFWSAKIEQLEGEARRHEIELRVWHEPTVDGQYVIGCDPAGGSDDKNDRHAIQVFRCYADKLVQVAEYADNMVETRQAAWVLAYLAGTYRNCMINLELSGGYGKAVMTEFEHLREMLRADLYRERRSAKNHDWSDFLDNARWYLYRRPDAPTAAGYIINFQTSADNKSHLMNDYRDKHINDVLVINSTPLLQEMQIIVQNGISIAAPGNQKDDRTIAAALATHAYIQHFESTLIMQGETFEVVERREAGERTGGHIVDRIVSQYLKQITEEEVAMTPAQRWMEERGLV
jgi:hypothetical protein